MRWSVLITLCLAATLTQAQESFLRADFRREPERISEACKPLNKNTASGCAIEFFTDHPLHIAVGSLAPQNGFGVGGAFVTWKNTTNWRMTWDLDALGAMGGSYRAGGYMKLIHTPREEIHVITPVVHNPGEPTPPPKKPTINLVHPYTVFNLYAQTSSLNKMFFFGLGNNSSRTGQSLFGQTQTIIGINAIKPVYEWPSIRKLNLSLLGEVNGRFVSLRGKHGQSQPSIEALYDEATAPGLSTQPAFVQLGQGVRIKPVIGDVFQFNYLVNFKEYVAASNSHYSFERWTVDLNHTFYLYGYTQSAPKNTDTNGPDECGPLTEKCPQVSHSRNLSGSVGVRLLLSESITSASSVVPFYFQPTLGGSDIDGQPSLASFDDYRFRAPNILLLRESFEHSIWGPFGFTFQADQGKVALAHGDIGFDHLKHSFASGLTLRAGGFPMVYLMFAWGGGEGTHTIFNLNTSLLGGSARPSLY